MQKLKNITDILSKRTAFQTQSLNYALLQSFPIAVNTRNSTISTATIVAPVGVENKSESISPTVAAVTEMHAEQITTDLKPVNTRIAESAGKTISADMRSEPTSSIASTIITAEITAIRVL